MYNNNNKLIGNEYKGDGKFVDAIEYYRKYLELDPKDPAAHR